MKKMSKRFLSMFLAAVMVFTTVPYTALTAFAKRDAEADSYAYLTSSIDSVFTQGTSTDVTWDNTEKAARFNGGYLKFNNFHGFDNLTTDGFAVSFDFKKTSSTGRWGFVFSLSDGDSEADRFAFNAGSNTDEEWHRGASCIAVGDSYNWYYSNDFDDTSFVNTAASDWKPDNDTWYNMALYMNSSGEFSYFINGTLWATFKANYETTSNGNVTYANIVNALKTFHTLKVGAGALGGERLDGYVKNLQFYSYAAADSAKNLKTAITTYEAMMADGNIYKNLSTPYTYYQKASALYDAYLYGEADTATYATENNDAANNLALSLCTMNKWNGVNMATPDYNPTKAFTNDSVTAANIIDAHYVSLLYATPSANTATTGSENNYLSVRLCIPQYVVAFWDGTTTPQFGAMPGYKGNTSGWSNKPRSLNCFYVTNSSSEIRPNANWKVRNNTTNYDFTWELQTPSGDVRYTKYTTTDSTASTTNNSWRSLAGHLAIYPTFTAKQGYKNYGSIEFTGRNYDSELYATVSPNFANVYVINYKGLKDAYDAAKTVYDGIDVRDYKEGGLKNLFDFLDKAAAVDFDVDFSSNTATKATTLGGSITTALTAYVDNSITPVVDSNYKAVKNAIDNTANPTSAPDINTTVVDAYATKTANANDGSNTLGATKATFANFASAYETARTRMKQLADVTTTPAYPTASVAATANNLNNYYNALTPVNIANPELTDSCNMNANGTFTITNKSDMADGNLVYYYYVYTNADDSTTRVPASGETSQVCTYNTAYSFTPFTGHEECKSVHVYAYVIADGQRSTVTDKIYTNIRAPYANKSVADEDETVTLTSVNATPGTIYYQVDGGSILSGTSFVPFPSGASHGAFVNVTVYETVGGVTSVSRTIPIYHSASLTAYADPSDPKGAKYFNSESAIKIAGTSGYTGDIKYTISIDGVEQKTGGVATETVYGTNENIVTDFPAVSNAGFIKVTAWAVGAESEKTVTTLFNSAKFDPLIYRESFNGTLSSNTYMPEEGGKGLSMTGTGTIEKVPGAGTYRWGSTTEAYSWRNNVLKINANSTIPGPVVNVASNPLSVDTNDGINAAAAKSEGVTIAFWRHIEDTSGNTVANIAENNWDNSGYEWKNAIAFQNESDNSTYYIVEVNGVNSRRIDGDNYIDVAPENQDNTTKEQGNSSGEWEHVAVTINPTGGIHVYTNGVEHDYKCVNVHENGAEKYKHTGVANYNITGETVDNAAEIIDFLTDEDTIFTLDNGVIYEGNPYNLFLDDIRIYAQTLTQVEINNMFTDEYADVQTVTQSTSHDPTSVTVYTLKNAVSYEEQNTHENRTKPAGSKVGVEFIEKYGVSDSDIQDVVDYYSFGTGMTIYHSTDNVNWTVIGDTEGRCGYQNQDLFGDEYTTALASAVSDAGFSASEQAQGAGHLVWAPHVMYNLKLDKWVYYAALSYWGATHSVTFMCTSDDPIKNYDYQEIVYKSTAYHPNAIDSSFFYGRNADGTIDASRLYMTIGSWGWSHTSEETVTNKEGNTVTQGRYGAIFGAQVNPDGTAPSNLKPADSLESAGSTENGGSTTVGVELARAYMQDVEIGADSGAGSAEGSYVIYMDGYYYLFVSYGSNADSYTERVFRSTNPLGPYYALNGTTATNPTGTDTRTRGNQILAPFDIKLYDHIYRSTGHNSVYKVKNNYGEWVYLNAVHGRPYASEDHKWVAVPDNALAKRQLENTGNVCLNNMVALTEDVAGEGSWMVMFPSQYDGTDSLARRLTAHDLEGIYTADDMRLSVNSDWGKEYNFTMLAKSDTTGVAYGVKTINGEKIQFTSRFEIKYDSTKKVNYFTLYNDNYSDEFVAGIPAADINDYIRYRGVVASKLMNVNGKRIINPMIGMINCYNGSEVPHVYGIGEQTWAYRSADIPDVDKVISEGKLVSSSGVIYTHADDATVLKLAGKTAGTTEGDLALKSGYAVYGQEISDNYTFGNKDASGEYTSGGERFTTVALAYPAYVVTDPSDNYMSEAGTVISLNDTEYCREYGKTGSNMRLQEPEAYRGYWCEKNKDGSFTRTAYRDDDVQTAISNGTITENWAKNNLFKVYGLTGTVSNFFRYYNNENDGTGTVRNGYPKSGVTLVISYVDKVTGTQWSEFAFLYVQPNPAWAHTMGATKNEHTNMGNNYNSSYGIFNRFEGSYGEGTDISSSTLYYAARGSQTAKQWGFGVSGYLNDFGSHSFGDSDLNNLDKIQTLFYKFSETAETNIGVNSGSYSAASHNDDNPNSFVATPQLVKAQYYVDYSDTSQYKNNNPTNGMIRVNGSGVPIGYEFKMKTSNFLWDNYTGSSIMDVTSYAMNTTGLNVTYSSTESSPYKNKNGPAPAQPYNDEYMGNFTYYGIYDTNYPFFGTDVTGGGYKRWFDDSMLFHTDMRASSNYLYDMNYRNKVLYYFSDRNVSNMQYLKRDDVSYHLFGNGTKFVDDTAKDGTPSKVWNYYDYSGSKAYTTASNGKGSTNTWKGVATFTGRDRLNQNTTETLQAIAEADTTGSLSYSNGRLYDGYYYYYTSNDKQHEGWQKTQPSSGTEGTDWGKLDVTAENMANYILEMGNYHKISDTGVGGGRFLGSETYHYYNIGVATCDKGAARDFMNNFALKRLVAPIGADGKRHVTLDANGHPTVDTNMDPDEGEILGDADGNLWVQDVSAKSYRDYINALARLEWFVNNPTNTVQNDLANEFEYKDVASVMTSSDEYVTAYSGTTPVYVTTKNGANVFNDEGVSVNTDQVQAKLIADVIEAYENLYTVEDYKNVEREYYDVMHYLDDKVEGNYTTESWNDFVAGKDALLDAVKYYTVDGAADDEEDHLINTFDKYTEGDIYDKENFWRYSEYSGADYEAIKAAMDELKDSLMPKVYENALQTTVDDKADDVAAGIYEDGVQIYRFDQWNSLYNRVVQDDGTKFVDPADATEGLIQAKAPEARYETVSTKYIDAVIGKTDEAKEDTTLPYEVYRIENTADLPDGATAGTDTTYVSSGDVYVTLSDGKYAVLSEHQAAVNTENEVIGAMTIDPVDSDSAYQTYNAVHKMVDESVVLDKYLPAGQALITGALSTKYENLERNSKSYGPVYVHATSAEKTLYDSVVDSDTRTAQGDVIVNDDLRCTGLNKTDPITEIILTSSSDVDAEANKDTYVKKFKVDFTVRNGESSETSSQNVYYGEPASFTIPEGARYNSTFTITYFAGLYNSVGAATGSSKFTYAGDSFTKIAKSNMAVACKMTTDAATSGLKKVELRDIYGAIDKIIYVNEADLAVAGTDATLVFGSSGETWKAPSVPFYTFTNWQRGNYTSEGVNIVYYIPKYNAGDTMDITVAEGTVTSGASKVSGTTYKAAYDSLVTIDATEVSNFWAWATVDSVENKYQIASYEKAYSFYAVVPEDFVVVKKVGGVYKVGDTALTAANVDSNYTIGYVEGGSVITPDVILKNKLDGKAPFVSLIAADITDGNHKANAYLRVTTGASTGYSEIGVLATSKEANKAYMVKGTATLFTTSTVLNTGQFSYTISRSASKTFSKVTFRGYVAYQLPFWYGDMDPETDDPYTLNVSETSENIIVASATV